MFQKEGPAEGKRSCFDFLRLTPGAKSVGLRAANADSYPTGSSGIPMDPTESFVV